MPTGSRGAALALAVTALTSAPPLSASTPERDAAREIARSGAEYYDDGAWEIARDHFHRAYQLVPAPTLALMEARALARLGRMVEAIIVYELAAKHLVDPGNDAYRRAAAAAQVELDELRSRVPRLTITRPAESGVRVRVDASVVSEDALRAALTLDPGTHLVELQRDGESKTWVTVTLREGDRRVLPLELPADERWRAMVAFDRHRTAMWSALAIGGAGMLVGVGAGAIARHQPVDAPCAEPTCPARSEGSTAPVQTWRTVSSGGYALGLVGLATGGLLFVTLPRSMGRTRVTAAISPAGPSIAVAGAF